VSLHYYSVVYVFTALSSTLLDLTCSRLHWLCRTD